MSEFNEIRDKIIQYLRRNRVSTTEVADCLGKSGVLPDIMPIVPGMYVTGKIHYIYAHSESNWPIHEQIQNIPSGNVILMDAFNVAGRALAGELVTKYLCLYRQAAAVVSLGQMRDANDLIKNRYPVWCLGFNPVGCFNHQVEETPEIRRAVTERKEFFHDAVIVCDDTGVVVIPKDQLTDEFLRKLEQIEQQEDTWFNCIDFRKWNTFETVCLKRYLK